jgi:uncharacterized protein
MKYIFTTFLIGILYLIDAYVFQGIKTFSFGIVNETIRNWCLRSYWGINIAFYIVFFIALVSLDRSKGMQLTQIITFNAFIALFIPKLVFSGFLFAEDVVRLAQGIWNTTMQRSSDDFIPSRRLFVAQLAMGAAAIPFGAILYGMVKGKYSYRVHRHTIHFPDLPDAFDGFKITQLSDIHAGSFDNIEAVKRGVALANAQQSDIIVFTGDLVNNEAAEIIPYQSVFQSLEAPFGKFSILGNHDYGDYKAWGSLSEKQNNFRALLRYHAEMGFRLLLDEHLMIEKDGQSLALIGVENWGHGFAQYGDLAAATKGLPDDCFAILLSHDPTHWEKQVKQLTKKIHLTLSGHTHGAQMGVELGNFKWSPIKFRYPKWAGLYQEAGKYLYINRGFGFLGFSGRVGILPEITVLELKKA